MKKSKPPSGTPRHRAKTGAASRSSLPSPPAPHFIVGVGASAGGLEALGKLFVNMPADSDLSFVVVQHLSPDYKSFMVELLSKRTVIPVLRAEDGIEVKPNHIYLIPPKKNLKIFQGRLLLVDPDLTRGVNLPIDVFFRSLAEEKQHQAIGIVLSGTGSDGTMGIRAIKDAGGMVMVQSEATAQFDGMPRSAIGTGLADSILPPEEMPRQLLTYLQHPFVANRQTLMRNQTSTDTLMHKIFALLRDQCGVDFSFYKPSTIDRRIERRISINQLHSLDEYFQYLHSSPREAGLLFQELLICVTRFFRDREAFEHLEKDVIPDLCQRAPANETLRIWVASCSTGEEAYSLAMLFADEMRRQGRIWPVKIFATDISKNAIEIASHGLYSESEVADVPPDKLKRFFTRKADGWQVSPALRQMVVFAKHDLLKDPPFTKLDFVSCRNVLIYFQSALQSRVVNVFHFALKPGGILFLGSSETIGDHTEKFNTLNTRHKLYQTRPGAYVHAGSAQSPVPERSWQPDPIRLARHQPAADLRLLETVYQQILTDYGPACIVVDDNNEITHVLGKAGDYLHAPPGAFTRNILKLTSHNLSVTLATMLHRVNRDGRAHAIDNVRFHQGRKVRSVRLRVKPVHPENRAASGIRLIFIEPKDSSPATPRVLKEFKADHTARQRIKDLEQELVYSKETLQATIEELETSNEELQAANEELLAANEELQSTNEELQSVNEELHTVNTENQNRIEELTALGNDINNLLASTRVGTMLVDPDLRIRRMSTALQSLTHLTSGDIGAPLEVLSRELQSPEIIDLARQVSRECQTLEHLVSEQGGRTLLVRLAPYRTETNAISGLVLTVIDLTENRRKEALVQGVVDAMPAHVAVVDDLGRILLVNQAWRRFAQSGENLPGTGDVGSNYFEVCRAAQDRDPAARRCLEGLESLLRDGNAHFETEYPCHTGGSTRWFLVHASRLPGNNGLVIAHVEITRRKEQEARMEQMALWFQSTRHAVVGCDRNGRVVVWNSGADRLLGWTADHAEGRNITDFTPPDARAEQRALHARVLGGEELPCQPARRLSRDHGIVHVGIVTSPARNADGLTTGIIESFCHCSSKQLPGSCSTSACPLPQPLRRKPHAKPTKAP
ncbi:MAG: PAS domain-containing protein [Verrucomicrobiae bacterium]|nr:PAS domain-containing protein [Verrucomicrobiae bacterium]